MNQHPVKYKSLFKPLKLKNLQNFMLVVSPVPLRMMNI